MRRMPFVAILFFLCLAGCESQPDVGQKTKTGIRSKTSEQEAKATLAVHLKADKENHLSEIRFDGNSFKDMDLFEEYFQKKSVSGDVTLEFIDETNLNNRHTMKAATVARARKQKRVVAWVKENKGKVRYDYQYDAKGAEIKDAQPPGPDWLRGRIRIDYFCDVAVVELINSPVTDLSPLKGLANLEVVYLASVQVKDFSPLEGLTNLKWLFLQGTQVKDLLPLKGLTNLKGVDLMSTPVTDLSSLEGLTNLEYLSFNFTQVTDLSPLKGLINLERLRLEETQVSDLSPLANLTKLKELWLHGAKVTKEEVRKIKKALPNCKIIWFDK